MRAQPKKGGSYVRAQPQKDTSTTRKRGEFRTYFVKERVLGTEVAQKGVLGAYLCII